MKGSTPVQLNRVWGEWVGRENTLCGSSYASLLGHERLLCPCCLQVPHRRFRLDGGSRSSLTVGCGGRTGVPGVLTGVGTLGNGQVVSLSPSGQKGRILSYMYHCLSADRPLGGTIDGNSFGSGNHELDFSYLSCVSMFSYVHSSWQGGITPKVVVLLDARYLLQLRCEEVCPVVSWNNHTAILVTHQLSKVALCRVIHCLSDALQAPNLRSAEVALEKTKTPIRGELCMADD